MSFILDAIKKSDQQRQRGATPTLLTVPAATVESRQPAVFMYWGLAAVTLSAGIAIGWLRPWQAEKTAPAIMPAMPPQTAHGPQTPTLQPAPQAQEKFAGIPRKAAPASVPEQRVQAVPANAAPEPAAMALRDLPPAVRREIPELRLSMHAYSPRPEARIVSINDRLLHEGDSAADGVKLEEITPDGMIFSYKEFRFRRGVR